VKSGDLRKKKSDAPLVRGSIKKEKHSCRQPL